MQLPQDVSTRCALRMALPHVHAVTANDGPKEDKEWWELVDVDIVAAVVLCSQCLFQLLMRCVRRVDRGGRWWWRIRGSKLEDDLL